jgi:hypothetical protein
MRRTGVNESGMTYRTFLPFGTGGRRGPGRPWRPPPAPLVSLPTHMFAGKTLTDIARLG